MTFTIILFAINLLRTLLIIAIIYFALKLIKRYVLPALIEKGMKNMEQKMQGHYKQQQKPTKKEGEVTIEKDKNSKANSNKNKGDYVDFEEVE